MSRRLSAALIAAALFGGVLLTAPSASAAALPVTAPEVNASLEQVWHRPRHRPGGRYCWWTWRRVWTGYGWRWRRVRVCRGGRGYY